MKMLWLPGFFQNWMLITNQSVKWLRLNHQLQKQIIPETKMMKVRALVIRERDNRPLPVPLNHRRIHLYWIILELILPKPQKKDVLTRWLEERGKLNDWPRSYRGGKRIIPS